MTKLLIYIAEGIKFEVNNTINSILLINGVSEGRRGKFIGAIFECIFRIDMDSEVIVRLCDDYETVTTDGEIEIAAEFIFQLQRKMPMPLWVVDMGYNFNLDVSKFASAKQLNDSILSAL